MEAPPIFAARDTTRVRDFYLRCFFAIVIGGIGFWWPNWYALRIPSQNDPRMGFVFIYTLPIIAAAGIWATTAFKVAYRPRIVSVGLLLLVWAPALVTGSRIMLIIVYFARLLHGAH